MDITISRISENSKLTTIHRWEIARYKGSKIETKLTAAFDMHGDKINLRLGATYWAIRGIIARPLLRYVIDVEFNVDDADHQVMVTENAVYIPPELLGVMLSLGIGALRGMLALRTANTFLANYPLPVMSTAELLQNLQGASNDSRDKLPKMEFRMRAS